MIMHMKFVILSCIAIFSVMVARASEPYNVPAVIPGVAENSPAQAALQRFRLGSRSAALEMARPLADGGNADALFLIAFAMEAKEPAKLSRGQAMDYYYRKAAEAGHPEARLRRSLILLASDLEKERNESRQNLESAATEDPKACRILGEAWLRGLVTGKPDTAKAEEYWKNAATKGDTASSLLLARLHDGTFGFTELIDENSAIVFYKTAAEGGEDEALVPLGSLLLKSTSNPENKTEGRRWLDKAIEKKIYAAWLALGDYEMAVEKDGKLAQEYYHKGAEADEPGCMVKIAAGCGDPERRIWLRKAQEIGSPVAAAELGELLLKDNMPDYRAAATCLIAAAREGIARAQYNLGLLYLNRNDGGKDPSAAVTWLTEAMKAGDTEAQYTLGNLNEYGIGGPVNYANAGVLYTLACKKGHAAAATHIARMALEGLGTDRSPAQAKAHALLGLERGDQSANSILQELDGKLDDTESAKADKALADLRAGLRPTRGPESAKDAPPLRNQK
jgi:TPR repeat protein